MRVQIVKNVFKPSEARRTRTILERDSIVELQDAEAKELIDRKVAVEVKATKPAKEAKEEKKEEEPKKDSKKKS